MAAAGAGLPGCRSSSAREVVAYVALDSEFSRPILEAFQRRTGIAVRPVFDLESTKTVGLANRLIAERDRPRCDLFWNNEILHTLRLEREGLLRPFAPAGVESIPASFRDRDGKWYGFAARARVLIVNTERMGRPEDYPRSIMALAERRWAKRCGIARPLFGTTATHAAVLLARWGRDRAAAFFRQVREHAVVLAGNRQVAESVARGELDFGITDTDDAVVQHAKGHPVRLIFPDQGPQQEGTLLIPNTVALLRGAPHAANGEALAEYLLSTEVERRLAAGRSAQIPLRPDSSKTHPLIPRKFKVMEVDFDAAAAVWHETVSLLERLFA